MTYMDVKPAPKDAVEYYEAWKNWQASLLATLKKRRIQIEVTMYEYEKPEIYQR